MSKENSHKKEMTNLQKEQTTLSRDYGKTPKGMNYNKTGTLVTQAEQDCSL